MTMQLLKQIVLNTKSDCNNLVKNSYLCRYISSACIHNVSGNRLCNNKVLTGYFCNEHGILKSPRISLQQQQQHVKLFEGSILCNNKTAVAKIISINPIAVNSIRHYATSAPEVVNNAIAYNTGIFKFISESYPVELVTELFRLIHYQIGLPWWLTIVFTSMVARILINFPLTIFDLQNRAKQQNLKGELQSIAEHLKMKLKMEVQTTALTKEQAAIYFKYAMVKEQKELYIRENCHPFKSIAIVLVQAPVWVATSIAVRNMCFMLPSKNSDTVQDYIGLVSGGFGWMQNLTQADSMFVLPVVFGICGLITLEINDLLFNTKVNKKSRKILKNVYRGIMICMVPIAACVPSSMTLYWVTNYFCALVQNTTLLSPKIRRLVRIKETESEIQHPYSELSNRLLGRFRSSKLSVKA